MRNHHGRDLISWWFLVLCCRIWLYCERANLQDYLHTGAILEDLVNRDGPFTYKNLRFYRALDEKRVAVRYAFRPFRPDKAGIHAPVLPMSGFYKLVDPAARASNDATHAGRNLNRRSDPSQSLNRPHVFDELAAAIEPR